MDFYQPQTAFMKYYQHRKRWFLNVSTGERLKLVAEEWNRLSLLKKLLYEQIAQDEHSRIALMLEYSCLGRKRKARYINKDSIRKFVKL